MCYPASVVPPQRGPCWKAPFGERFPCHGFPSRATGKPKGNPSTMAVAVLSRWSGGDREKFIASTKKYKPILEKLGAEVRAGQISTGPHAGQWVATARFADWESFGKGVQGLLNDPSYLKLVGEMAETFKLENQTIITGIDL